jgi:hypothetical protein
MTRDEAMQEIAKLHTEWSLRFGDDVPFLAEDADPVAGESNLAAWQADRSAAPEVDDPLNVKIKGILSQIEE